MTRKRSKSKSYEPRHYTDEQIAAVLYKELDIKATDPHSCIRVRHVAWDIMGIAVKSHNKPSMPTQLAERIRYLAAQKGWLPDPTDTTLDAGMRLYKGGKP